MDLNLSQNSSLFPDPPKNSVPVDPLLDKLFRENSPSNPNWQPTFSAEPKALVEMKTPTPFGVHETNYYRYARRSNFDELGFTPYADNEALYNANSSAWGEIGRGLQGMLINTATTAADMAESSYDLITGNWGTMFDADPAAAQRFEDINRIYGSTEGGVQGFLANNAINLGFMTGMVLEGIGEGALASLVLGPEAGLPLGASKIVTGLRGLTRMDDVVKGIRAASSFDNIINPAQVSAALNTIRTSTPNWIRTGAGGIGKVVMPNATEFIGDAFKAASLGEALPSAARGAGALFREVQLIKAAATEAQLEGGFVQNELYQEGINLYYEDFGTMPSQAELENIAKAAKEAGDRTVMANLPFIYLTDAIVMKPILSMGKTTSRVLGLAGDMTADLSKYGIRQTADGVYEAAKKGFKNGLRNTFTPSGMSRLGRNVFLPAVSEGLQENFQEIVSQSYKDYYSSVLSDPLNIPFQDMKGTFNGIGEVLNLAADPALRRYSSEALKDQFSAQGLETFMSGAFIGGLSAAGGSKVAEWSKLVTAKGREEAALLKSQQEARTQELVDILNNGSKDVYSLFNPRIKNYIDQSKALAEWQKAKLQGDEKKQKDIVEELRFNHLMTVLQTGQMGNFKQKLAALQQLDDQGVIEATGLENAPEARERINQTIAYADNLEKKFKDVEKQYGNPFEASQYAPGSDAYNRVRTNHFAYDQAKRDLIFLAETQEKTKERLEALKADISRRNASGNTTSSDIDNFTSLASLTQELDLLGKEILAEATTPEQKQILAEKKKKRRALDKYRIARERYEKLISGENATDVSEAAQEKRHNAVEKIKQAYKEYVGITAKGNRVSEESIDNDVISIIDSIALGRDQGGLIDSINALNSPEKLTQYALRNAAILNDVIIQKRDYLAKSFDNFKKNLQKNEIINQIYKYGYFIGHTELKEYFDSGKLPSKIYTVKGRKEVDINSEEAADVKDLLNFFAPQFGAKSEEAAQPTTEDTPVTPQAQPEPTTTVEGEFAEDLTPTVEETTPTEKYQYNDLPQELKDIINDMFERENDKRQRNDENLIRSIAQYTTFPTPQRRIKEYFDANPPVDETAIVPATTEEAFESTVSDKKADIEKDEQGNFIPKKYTLNAKGKNPAPNISLAAIKEESFGGKIPEDVRQVKLLEIRGKNSAGVTVGTVWIQQQDGNSFTAEVFFNDAELAALNVDSKNNRIYLNLYTEQIEKATSLKALNKLEVDISTDSEMPESQANKSLARIAERKAELGAEVGEVVPPVAEEEKKLAEQSIPTSEDLIAKTNLTIEDAANKSKDDLDDDFFGNINEC